MRDKLVIIFSKLINAILLICFTLIAAGFITYYLLQIVGNVCVCK